MLTLSTYNENPKKPQLAPQIAIQHLNKKLQQIKEQKSNILDLYSDNDELSLKQTIVDMISKETSSFYSVGLIQQFFAYSIRVFNKLDPTKNPKQKLEFFINKLQETLTNQRNRIMEASKWIANYLKNFVKSGDRICLFGYSSIVMDVLSQLINKFKIDIKVIVIQTLIFNKNTSKTFEDQVNALKQLTNGQLLVIPESGLLAVMNNIDIFLVGAQAISQNCGLINLIGTSQVALLSSLYDKKFIVLTQTYKIIEDFYFSNEELQNYLEFSSEKATYVTPPQDVEYLQYQLDFTESKYISSIITEMGVFTTVELSDYAYKLFQKEEIKQPKK